jgi:hypothetical protein
MAPKPKVAKKILNILMPDLKRVKFLRPVVREKNIT